MMFKSFSDFQSSATAAQISPRASLIEACEMMEHTRLDVLGVAEAGHVQGIISEQDILRHVSQNGGLTQLCVADLMRVLSTD